MQTPPHEQRFKPILNKLFNIFKSEDIELHWIVELFCRQFGLDLMNLPDECFLDKNVISDRQIEIFILRNQHRLPRGLPCMAFSEFSSFRDVLVFGEDDGFLLDLQEQESRVATLTEIVRTRLDRIFCSLTWSETRRTKELLEGIKKFNQELKQKIQEDKIADQKRIRLENEYVQELRQSDEFKQLSKMTIGEFNQKIGCNFFLRGDPDQPVTEEQVVSYFKNEKTMERITNTCLSGCCTNCCCPCHDDAAATCIEKCNRKKRRTRSTFCKTCLCPLYSDVPPCRCKKTS